MELEEKIITELKKTFTDEELNLDNIILNKINRLVVYKSVEIVDKNESDKDAVNYIENKIYDLFNE